MQSACELALSSGCTHHAEAATAAGIRCTEAEEQDGADEDLPGPIPTTTLAELYSVQGFVDRAIETYRQVLLTQPDNEEAKMRLPALEHKD